MAGWDAVTASHVSVLTAIVDCGNAPFLWRADGPGGIGVGPNLCDGSELKLKLGKLWEAKAGRDYRYMMVFDNNPIDGAERLADALAKLRQL